MQDSLDDYVKLLQNVKEEPQIENKKEYLVKNECEARAIKIVEFSIDGKLRPEIFIKCLPYINQLYYQDIVEERALIKLCGYLICGKRIPDMPKKQYYISTKSNKIYDITDRKNFCSNFCYKASLHIKKQIDNSPLWLRKFDVIPEYELLGSEDKGLPGEFIDQGISKPQPSFISINNFTQASLTDMINQKETKKITKVKQKKAKKLIKTLETITENNEQIEDEKIIIIKHKNIQKTQNLSVIIENEEINTNCDKKIKNKKTKKINIEDILIKITKEWITIDTYLFLYDESKIKDILNDQKINDQYLNICKRINLQEINFNKLKLENKDLNVKVKCFYDGILHEKIDGNFPMKINESKINDDDDEEIPVVLPLVDGNSQKAMRRKIFLNAATKSMKELLDVLKINIPMIISDLQLLVKTFNLSADNIVFKPVIWNYISIILLKILSIRDSNLKITLEEKYCQEYIDLQLSILPHKDRIVNEIMHNISDMKLFIESSN